jgi:polar amino acid transport system permease protein
MIRTFSPSDALYIVAALRFTLALAAMAFAGGALLGGIVLVLRVLPVAALNWLAAGYIGLLQGTPLLGQLFLFYFGLSIVGLDVSAWAAAALALSFYASAFFAEIWRGCVQAIPRTQWEASAALGLGFGQQLRWVVLPQALRLAIPPTVGFSVQLVKNTSLASTIGFVELTRAGQIMNNATFSPLQVYLTVALLYFVVCFAMSRLAARLERRLRAAH